MPSNASNLIAGYYAEVDILCIILLGMLLIRTISSSLVHDQKHRFLIVLLCHIVFCVSDLVWIFNNGFISLTEVFPTSGVAVGYVLNSLNVLCSGITGLAWLIFSETMQGNNLLKKKSIFAITLLPVLFLAVLTATTNRTHILFHISDSGEFFRDSGYYLQLMVSYGYILLATFRSVKKAKQAKNIMERRLSSNIACFIIAPILTGILQQIIPHMQLLFLGTVFSLINVYISLLKLQINLDPLTKLNNRNMLDQKIESSINKIREHKETDLFLLLIDVDNFKKINDVYGHQIGDKALKLVADAIKESCGNEDYACRYGGDEFVMLHHAPLGEDCSQLIQNIENKLTVCVTPCAVSVSVGVCRYSSNPMKNPVEFLKAADDEMYRVKAAKKSGH